MRLFVRMRYVLYVVIQPFDMRRRKRCDHGSVIHGFSGKENFLLTKRKDVLISAGPVVSRGMACVKGRIHCRRYPLAIKAHTTGRLRMLPIRLENWV
jgi:hypothetical protein